MKKTVSLLFAAALAALTAAPAHATWTASGSTYTDGTWQLEKKSGGGIKFLNPKDADAAAATGYVMDLRGLDDDFPGDFVFVQANSSWSLKTTIKKVYLPNSCTSINAETFTGMTALEEVSVSPGLTFVGNCAFRGCSSLTTVYPNGTEDPEVGTVLLPPNEITFDNWGHFSNCSSIRKFIARGKTALGNRALAGCPNLEFVEMSPDLTSLTANNAWNQGPFHAGESTYLGNLVHFSPSKFASTFHTEAGNAYAGAFTHTGITNYLDFSECSTIVSFPEYFAYGTSIAGATFPESLTSLANKSFTYIRNAATFRFLGPRPTVSATNADAPFKNGSATGGNSANKVGFRHTFVVEPEYVASWTADGFVSVDDIKTSSDDNVKAFQDAVNNPTDDSYDFPTPNHPEETLGITSWGNQSNNYSWLVQYVDHSTVKATWVNGDTELGETDVPVGEAAAWSGATPEKASDAQFDYTFLGWNTDPAATTALSDLSISAATTFYAIYSAATRSYTITWNMDDGTTIDTTTVAYGETPTHANPSKEGSRFTGWSPAIAAVTGAATYTATFEEVTGESYTITWLNHDGTQLGQDTVAAGDTPAYTGSTPTKDPTVDTVYTFSGWTPAVAAASADATYTATFTAGVRTYVVRFVDDDGTEISSAEYAYGTAADGIAVPADPTKATTAEYSYAFAGWVPAVAAVSGDATYAASYAPTARTYTAIFSDGVLDAEIARHDYAYGAAVEAPTPPDHYEDGWSFKAWDPAISTMPASDANYTAVYTNNQYVITWVNGNGATIDTTKVAHGTVPSHSNPSLSATAKSTYSFLGWSTDGETVVSPLPAATGPVVYKAVYSRTVLQPMSLVLDSASYDTTQNEITVNTEAVSTDGGAIEGTAWYDDGKSVAATVDGNAIATTLTGLVAEHGYEWVVTASETAYGTTETASIRGRTWARNTRSWFEADAAALASGTYVPAKGSDSGAQVRLHATVALPDVLPRAPAAGGTAVVGIEAVQENAGSAPSYYAWNGTAWVRLVGAEPPAGGTAALYGVVDFARKDANGDSAPAVAWYADGVQLLTEAGDWEVVLQGSAANLRSLSLVGDFGLVSLAGEYDVGGNGTLILIY